MSESQIREIIAGVMTVGALAAVGYLAVVYRDEASTGALISILAAATGYLMRGKLQA